jgi:hypothetical protein
LTSATKSRLEQAQVSRVAAEEELAKQEALFAEKQVTCCSIQTIIYPPPMSLVLQVRIQEADALLTRGRSVQDSVKGALSELQSVVSELEVFLPALSVE